MGGHTPGPWDVTEIGTIENRAHNPVHIASVMPRNRKANAALIAAAPDLLEALRRIVSESDYTTPEGMKQIAREAIAKFKGG